MNFSRQNIVVSMPTTCGFANQYDGSHFSFLPAQIIELKPHNVVDIIKWCHCTYFDTT